MSMLTTSPDLHEAVVRVVVQRRGVRARPDDRAVRRTVRAIAAERVLRERLNLELGHARRDRVQHLRVRHRADRRGRPQQLQLARPTSCRAGAPPPASRRARFRPGFAAVSESTTRWSVVASRPSRPKRSVTPATPSRVPVHTSCAGSFGCTKSIVRSAPPVCTITRAASGSRNPVRYRKVWSCVNTS